jgi:hypothetical protein
MKSFTPREAYEGLLNAYSEMSSFKTSLKRGLKTFWNTRSLFSTGIAFSWNYHAYKTIRDTDTPLALRNLMPPRKIRQPIVVR